MAVAMANGMVVGGDEGSDSGVVVIIVATRAKPRGKK
jgi:hypothetical protein